MKSQKKIFQDWFRTIAWSHLITVEPRPSMPYSNDEILQRFRYIEFRLNKHFLKSSFSKWDPYDRFFMVAFAEGDGISHEKHFHLLMYSPVDADLQQQQFRKGVRHQNIWLNSRRRLAEVRPRLGGYARRRACGVASADVRWSVA